MIVRREYNDWMPTPPPLQPEQASFARDIALRNLAAEHPVTRRVLDAIPIEKGGYRPDAVAKSALDRLAHRRRRTPLHGRGRHRPLRHRQHRTARDADDHGRRVAVYAGVFEDDLRRVGRCPRNS